MTNIAPQFYKYAKQFVVQHFEADLCWQASRNPQLFNESDLLREGAWVILCCGFKEAVVRRQFSYLSLCFCDWDSSEAILESREACKETAAARFKNYRKLDAIIEMAERVSADGFGNVKQKIEKDPIGALQRFPFIGPITAFHLAKNLGFAVAKPDRHLERLATRLGYADTHAMCREVSDATGDPVQIVDLVLWRYAERQNSIGNSDWLGQLGNLQNLGTGRRVHLFSG